MSTNITKPVYYDTVELVADILEGYSDVGRNVHNFRRVASACALLLHPDVAARASLPKGYYSQVDEVARTVAERQGLCELLKPMRPDTVALGLVVLALHPPLGDAADAYNVQINAVLHARCALLAKVSQRPDARTPFADSLREVLTWITDSPPDYYG